METPSGQPVGQPGNQPSSQSNGLKPNIAGALAYVLGFVSGLIIYLISKDKFARFHALQSIIFSLFVYMLSYIIRMIPGFMFTLLPLVNIFSVILFILLIIKAYQGEKYKLPIIGDIAEKNA